MTDLQDLNCPYCGRSLAHARRVERVGEVTDASPPLDLAICIACHAFVEYDSAGARLADLTHLDLRTLSNLLETQRRMLKDRIEPKPVQEKENARERSVNGTV